jgi:hypothetical protein
MRALTEALSIIAAIFAATQAGAPIVLHVLPTSYDPIRNAVSDYGVDPYHEVVEILTAQDQSGMLNRSGYLPESAHTD